MYCICPMLRHLCDIVCSTCTSAWPWGPSCTLCFLLQSVDKDSSAYASHLISGNYNDQWSRFLCSPGAQPSHISHSYRSVWAESSGPGIYLDPEEGAWTGVLQESLNEPDGVHRTALWREVADSERIWIQKATSSLWQIDLHVLMYAHLYHVIHGRLNWLVTEVHYFLFTALS